MTIKMCQQMNGGDRIRVLFHSAAKVLRGLAKSPWLKEVKGLLFVGDHVVITHGNRITCGKNVKFESYSEIQGLCLDGLSFGDNVTIGRGVMIRPSSYYGVDLGSGLTMGGGSSIGPHGYIGCAGPIKIGSNTMLGPKCSLFAENHNFGASDRDIKEQGVNRRGIVIGDNCWIGSNVIILDGVTIGDGCVIGAGTLVAKDIEPNSIVIDKRSKVDRPRAVE